MKKIWKNKKVLIVVLILGVIFGNVIFNKLTATPIEEVPYYEFTQMVEDDKVQEIKINLSASSFTFVDDKNNQYKTSNPRNESFKSDLLNKKIKVTEISSLEISAIVNLFVQGLFILIIFKTITSLKPNMKNKKGTQIKDYPDINLDDVIVPVEVKNDIQTLIDFVKNPKIYTNKGASLPKGVILYGPPGTGKTLIAKAIAGQAKIPFYSISGSDFVEMFVGVGAKRVRELFDDARKNAPCILFIDEFDAIGRKRGANNSTEADNTINALLTELDGFNESTGILTIAATNRIEDLDPALIRSGRFDKHIKISVPMTKEERLDIIKIHSKNKTFDESVDFNNVAKLTFGFSGAEIETLLNEATINSVLNKHDRISQSDINKAFNQIVLQGHQNKKINKDKDLDEISRIAYHEAGHAIVSKLLCKENVSMISIVATTTGAGGYTISMPDNYNILTKDDLENKIRSLYAGRAAEVVAGYGISAGASNDIEKATSIIKAMYTEFGMGDNYILNTKILNMNDDVQIINEIKNAANTIYKETEMFLTEHMSLLKKVVDKLIEKETLDEDDLTSLFLNEK